MLRHTPLRFGIISLMVAVLVVLGASLVIAAVPPNDDFGNATIIPEPLPFTEMLDTTEATTAIDDPGCLGQTHTVWYAFTPSRTIKIQVDTFGSDYFATLSAYTGTRGNLTQIACADLGPYSLINFTANRGRTYFFVVGALASSGRPGGDLVFRVREEPAQNIDRSLDEFLAVQGTFCYPDGQGGCAQFQGPQPQLLGFQDDAQNRCAIVDYAGVIDRWLQAESGGAITLGTTVTGTVKEHRLQDGTPEISVRLVTTNALVFVVAGCDGYGLGPLLFGRSPAEVLAGATPSLGDISFVTEYIVPTLGLPLKDLVELYAFPVPGEGIKEVFAHADARGELRAAFGVPDGTPGIFSARQRVNFDKYYDKIIKVEIDLTVK